jgi:hypothetical protein
LRARTEIDRAQVIRKTAIDVHALVTAFLHQPLGAAQLRMGWDPLVHVTLHARQRHLHQTIGFVL